MYKRCCMSAVSYSQLRANLASIMEEVCESHQPTIVTRQKANSVVMMSLADYESMRETCYLMGNARNATRLMKSIEEIENNGGQERQLLGG